MQKSFLNRADLVLGLRNNNPGNLIRTSEPWKGKIPHSKNTDPKFEQFYELRYGLRAMIRNIITQINNGYNTIEKLITRYAPPSDNNKPEAYIKFVVNNLGAARHATIDMSEETIIALTQIIARMELDTDAYLIKYNDYKEAIAILDIPLKKSSNPTLTILLLVLLAIGGYKAYKSINQ